MLPTLIFKNRAIYGANVLYSGCPETDALFELIAPRQYLTPSELVHIAKMGYQWKITGDIPSFNKEMSMRERDDEEDDAG